MASQKKTEPERASVRMKLKDRNVSIDVAREPLDRAWPNEKVEHVLNAQLS